MKDRLTCIQIYLNTSFRDFDGPEQQCRRFPRVVRMWAQRAHRDAVNSYEGESALVPPLIRADKFASHESGVCMEAVSSLRTGVGIGSRPAESEVDLADNTGEIRYGGWVTPFGMSAGTIGWG